MIKLEAFVNMPDELKNPAELCVSSLIGIYGLKWVNGDLSSYMQSISNIPVLRYEEQEKLHKGLRKEVLLKE